MDKLKKLIDMWGLYLEYKQVESRDDIDLWDDAATHWKVKIKSTILKGKYKTYYSIGSALQRPPRLEDLLESLAFEYHTPDCHRDWKEFATEMGESPDSIKMYKLWVLICNNSRKLLKFLGPAAIEQLTSIEF